jgi:uncharacterized DUF497 family protein
MAVFVYDFEWDPAKAASNLVKHGVSFELAIEVFRDPLALTIPDEEHSFGEFRWITLGKDARSQSILVVHTFEQPEESMARIRIISARRPSRSEILAYEEHQ